MASARKVTYDARPDRIDFRDRAYRPPLVSLPRVCPAVRDIVKYFPLYKTSRLVRRQGDLPACSGFGLAAVINYIAFERWAPGAAADWSGVEGPPPAAPARVSPWMLYDLARVYDEWEGEDYSGSSCRGAMKGWHKHGACREDAWGAPGATPQAGAQADWKRDAARRPLGAYYRVDARSISDMQAAIHEVRAVFASAAVHDGWDHDSLITGVPVEDDEAEITIPMIDPHPNPSEAQRRRIGGGHAFAIMGYTPRGFIIQNSWGEDWGSDGFAILPYEDWAANGWDAWVAAMAAPMQVDPLRARDGRARGAAADAPAEPSMARTKRPLLDVTPASRAVDPKTLWSLETAYAHTVVMGHDGKLLTRLVDAGGEQAALQAVIAAPWRAGAEDVLIYAHSGLTDEDAAMARIRRLGPVFAANGIHPIFVVWRTSLMEAIGGIGRDLVEGFLREKAALTKPGDEQAARNLQARFDKSFEAEAEQFIGKAVWSKVKDNARAAATGRGGLRRMVSLIHDLTAGKIADVDAHRPRLHLSGHSAGVFLIGHMLDDLKKKDQVQTVRLTAPACSLAFADRHFRKALKSGVIPKGRLVVETLADRIEQADAVGPYGKSLLYLVSRAFEETRKTPLLGLARAWAPPAPPRRSDERARWEDKLSPWFSPDGLKRIDDWAQSSEALGIERRELDGPQQLIRREPDRVEHAPRAHAALDADLDLIDAAVKRMLAAGDRRAKPKRATNQTDISAHED